MGELTLNTSSTGDRPVTLDDIESAVERTVVVTSGEDGRDLDIVCRTPERMRLRRLLSDMGYRHRGRRLPRRAWTEQWARFDDHGTWLVDLNPAERWGVGSDAVDGLFDDAVALPGMRRVCRPSPAHGLILLARRLGRAPGPLSDKQRRKLGRVLSGEPDAWDDARAIARRWNSTAALEGLAQRSEASGPGRADRLRALAEPLVFGQNRLVRLRAQARALPVPRRPLVIGFSGVDGSGKSTQIARLRSSLGDAGVESTVAWRPLGHGRVLRLVRRSAKRVVSLGGGGAATAPLHAGSEEAPALTWDPNPATRRLRERSPALTSAWAAYVAATTAAPYLVAALNSRIRRRVLICDRAELDLAAHLVFQYGGARRPRAALRLSHIMFPRVDAAFYLDVSRETARGRKALQYTESEVDRLLGIYRSEAARLGALVLDGERPPDEIAALIACEAWRAADG